MAKQRRTIAPSDNPSTTIQTWPRGTSYTYQGDVWGPPEQRRLRTRTAANGISAPFRPGTPEEWRTIRITVMAERYAERDILAVQSSLVTDLMQAGDELPYEMAEAFRIYDNDDLHNIYADPSDWDAGACRAYMDDNGIDWPDAVPNPWAIDRAEAVDVLADVGIDSDDDESIETIREAIRVNLDDETIEGIEELRDTVRDHAHDNPAEPYEWWLVSRWLCEELRAIGEVVLDNGYGRWWGRTTTGQGLIMDGVLQRVAARHVEVE